MSRNRAWSLRWRQRRFAIATHTREGAIAALWNELRRTMNASEIGPIYARRWPMMDRWAVDCRPGTIHTMPRSNDEKTFDDERRSSS